MKILKNAAMVAAAAAVVLSPISTVLAAPTDYYDAWVEPITRDISALSDLQLESNAFVLVYDEAKGTYRVELNPEVLTTDAYDKLVGDINTALGDLKNEINGRADQVKVAVAAAIVKFKDIETQLNQLASDIEQRVNQAIDEVIAQLRAELVELVRTAVYNSEYDSSVKTNAYNDAFAKATQDAATWQAEVDAYEAPGGIIDQIDQAATAANNAYNNLPNYNIPGVGSIKDIVKNILGITDAGITSDWIIGNATSLGSSIGSVNCTIIPFSGVRQSCDSVKTQIQSVLNNLNEYNTYKDLLANPPADPAAYATEKANEADKNEQKRAQDVADGDAWVFGLLFDQTIDQIKDRIDDLRDEVKAYIDEYITKAKAYIADAIAEIEAYAGKVAEWADQTWDKILTLDSGLTLTATTTHAATGVTGSLTESYTIGDVVDAINGNHKSLFDNNYALTLPASIFDGVNNCTLATLGACSEITLDHQFALEFNLPAFTLDGFTIPEITIPLLDFDELKLDLPFIGTVNLNNLLNNRIQYAVAGLNDYLGLTGGLSIAPIVFGDLSATLAVANSTSRIALVRPAKSTLFSLTPTAPKTGVYAASNNSSLNSIAIALATALVGAGAIATLRKIGQATKRV
ncbi:MAG: hypothetical protein LBK50_03325 [Candidatus Nomurabacteria bacterium]|jgi:hypothetical protein|nr:hypothetical protein [Candidatus Nomurabacteria bacterium]